MDADLTCPTCKGEGTYPCDWELCIQQGHSRPRPGIDRNVHRCEKCNGTGRRPPTLAEWDALHAERDRLSELVGEDEEDQECRHGRFICADPDCS